jgi:hypothetical protein
MTLPPLKAPMIAAIYARKSTDQAGVADDAKRRHPADRVRDALIRRRLLPHRCPAHGPPTAALYA